MLIRPADPADALAVARVHVQTWQVAYRGIIPDGYLDGLRPEDQAARYTFGSNDPAVPSTRLAVDDRRILGFATVGPSRDEDRPNDGELTALYVDPDAWDPGVGRALMADARGRLVEAGYHQGLLWVLSGNERAQRFYRLDGWHRDIGPESDRIRGVDVEVVRYVTSLR